jgi:hypothetical protein
LRRRSAGVKIILAAPAAAILAKRFPNKRNATKSDERYHVVWAMKK